MSSSVKTIDPTTDQKIDSRLLKSENPKPEILNEVSTLMITLE